MTLRICETASRSCDAATSAPTQSAASTSSTALIGDGRGGFAEANGSPFDFRNSLFHVVIADPNRDGKKDVLAAGGDSVRVILGDGRGGFSSAVPVPVGRGAWRVAMGDLNGDGRVDLVTSNSESKSVSVLLGGS